MSRSGYHEKIHQKFKKKQVKLMRQLVNLHIHLQLIMISPVITIKLYSNASDYYTLFVHYEINMLSKIYLRYTFKPKYTNLIENNIYSVLINPIS